MMFGALVSIGVIFAVAVVFCFSFVLLFGAPFLPTLKPQISTALELLDLEPGQTLLELGCGDGRVLIAAAKQGLNVVGYELNPILAVIAWLRTRRYRRQVRVSWGDYWRVSWPKADGIFGFILPRYMGKLDKKVMQYSYRPSRVASFAFPIPNREARAAKAGVFLYEYK